VHRLQAVRGGKSPNYEVSFVDKHKVCWSAKSFSAAADMLPPSIRRQSAFYLVAQWGDFTSLDRGMIFTSLDMGLVF
jgi:hypothetical protein